MNHTDAAPRATRVAALFLAGVAQAATPEFVGGLHKAFLTLGAVTVLACLVFSGLRPGDGRNVSGHRPAPARR